MDEEIEELIIKYDDWWFNAEQKQQSALSVLPSIVADLRKLLKKFREATQQAE